MILWILFWSFKIKYRELSNLEIDLLEVKFGFLECIKCLFQIFEFNVYFAIFSFYFYSVYCYVLSLIFDILINNLVSHVF